MKEIRKFVKFIIEIVSGEIVLRSCANSGMVVLGRSSWISIEFFLLAIGIYSILSPLSAWGFDAEVFRCLIREKFEWFGALMGVTYLSLYSRFSSQWQYLADLYNRIKAADCERPISESTPLEERNPRNEWRHAFIADAIELHLARKKTFKTAIKEMLKDHEVYVLARGEDEDDHREFESFCKSIGFSPKGPQQKDVIVPPSRTPDVNV